jgi:hypothetical protein
MDMLTDEEIKAARDWWTNVCPDEIKGNCSIWTVLARYGRYVLAQEQELKIDGKFSVRNGQIVNRVSNEPIPEDEPLFLLRGRDHNAYDAILNYLQLCLDNGCNDLHLAGIRQTVQTFIEFRHSHPERMKQPGITKHLKLEDGDAAGS